jgi:hypothetical protein
MPPVRKLSSALFAITVAAVSAGAVTTAAQAAVTPAATTWTVSPGGAFTGTATALTWKDTTANITVSCKPAGIGGTLKKGSKLPGAGLGTITSFTSAKEKCTGPAGIPFTLGGVSSVKWPLNAVSYKSGVTSGTITGIHFTASASSCTVTVNGTGATANNGSVNIKYTNTGAKLAIVAGTGNLHLYKVTSGCAGIIKNGDVISLSATYTLTPAQKITSP